MGDTAAERAAALQKAIEATRDKDPVVQQEAVRFLMTAPTQTTTDKLWRLFVGGLIAVLIIDLLGSLVMLGLGKFSMVLLTVFTTTLAGLVGVFAPSPTKG